MVLCKKQHNNRKTYHNGLVILEFKADKSLKQRNSIKLLNKQYSQTRGRFSVCAVVSTYPALVESYNVDLFRMYL